MHIISPEEIICMKCQILIFWEKLENILKMLFADKIFTQHAKHSWLILI